MSKIVISQVQKTALADARKHGYSRKGIWSDIRRQFGIPTSLRLAVTVARELYVKGTDPKQYLMASPGGAYSHTAIDTAATAAPAPDTKVTAVAAASRFVVAKNGHDGASWTRMTAKAAAALLRDGGGAEYDSDDVTYNATLPAGFPADAGADALIFDTSTGDVYFRA